MKTYTVRVTREGEFVLATIDELPGAHTYSTTMTDLYHRVVDMVTLVTGSADFALNYIQETA